MSFACIQRTHVGLKRKINEDSVACFTDRGLWAVADGMGGHSAGDVASQMVVAALGRIAAASPAAMTRQALAELQEVNRALVELGHATPETRTIGSTIVGLAIGEGQYSCFWAGDSRAYRIRDGSIVQISRDHSLVQDLVKAGIIKPAEAETHPNANVITRAVGAGQDLVVDTVEGVAGSGDIFLLASDGLTRVVSQVEILAALYSKPLDVAADHLLKTVLDRGAPDNVSMVIVRIE